MSTLNLDLMKKMVSYNNKIFYKVSSTEVIKRNILVLRNDIHYNDDDYEAEFVLADGDEIILDKENRLYLIPILEHTFMHVDRVIKKRQESLLETGRMFEIPVSILDKLMKNESEN